MSIYEYHIRTFDIDTHEQVPPSMIQRMAVEAATRKIESEGATKSRMRDILGATWMMGRVRVEMHRPIYEGSCLQVEVTHCAQVRGSYYRLATFRKDGETVAECATSFVSVGIEDRKIVHPKDMDRLWINGFKPLEKAPAQITKLRPTEQMEHICDFTVHGWDCDFNKHMTAHRYTDFVCEAVGYWTGGKKLMRSIQIDYSSECVVGETLSLFGAQTDSGAVVRGVHSSGITAFTARCDMCNLRLDIGGEQ